MTNMLLRLNYEHFFNGNETIQELLEPLNKMYLLRAVSYLINKSKFEKDSILTISNWFKNPILQSEFIVKAKKNGSILNIYSSLKLLTYIYEKDENVPEAEINTDEFELRLFKIYLLINSEQDKIEKAGKINLPIEDKDQYLSASLLILSYHDYDLQNYDLKDIFLVQLIKSIDFFQFLEEDYKLSNHLNLFLSNYNCKTWKEWIFKLLNLIIPVLNHDNETYSEIRFEENENFVTNSSFINFFTIPIDYNELPDFVNLRSNPILKIDKKTFIIINKLFLVERIFKSVIFEFSLKINANVIDEFKLKNFRAIYCDHFSEQIMLYNALKGCFPKNNKWIKSTGEDFKKLGYSAEPDYYIRFKNKILLFESKDVILKGDVKQSRDFSILSKSLKEKFLIDKSGNKAILQIIENIHRFFSLSYDKIDNCYNVSSINIYPILVTHDRQFDTLELNRLINIWFKKELKAKFNLEQLSQINDLVIINIDTLILYQEHFKKRGEYGLEIMIKKYFDYITPRPTRTLKEKTQIYLDTAISFSNYVERKFDHTNFKTQPSFIDDYIEKLDLK